MERKRKRKSVVGLRYQKRKLLHLKSRLL